MKTELKIDWATHESAKYACENWHYSRAIPKSKLFKLGVWENGEYIGIIIFGSGASAVIHCQFGVRPIEICELVRIALKDHESPVSKMMSVALKFLRKHAPGIRVVVSFADPNEGHHGGVYQATNWIYTGMSQETTEYFYRGKWRHVTAAYKSFSGEQIRKFRSRKKPGKYRYVMPLDTEMRKRIIPLSKPYPKRAGSDTSDTPGFHPGEGGSLPTPALHSNQKGTK